MDDRSQAGLTPGLTLLFAFGAGATVANIYYSQPLIGLISQSLGMETRLAGLIVTLTQIGYGAGLFFIVSLSDLVENRRLIQAMTLVLIAGLLGVASSHSVTTFMAASFLVGIGAVGTQVLVPFAVHLAREHERGRVVGNVMAGLLSGIMLARPISSGMAAYFGWRSVFVVSAVAMAGLLALLSWRLPRRFPKTGEHYGQILLSMLRLMATEPALQRRAFYQGSVSLVFNMFWTAVPLLLADRFGFDQRGIALFALAGAGGALAAPLAGRLGDRGYVRAGTGLALVGMLAALLLSGWFQQAHWLIGLGLAAILLDAMAQTNQVMSQRVIYSLSAEMRGRLNAAYMTVMFLMAALGSTLAALLYVGGGWWQAVSVPAGLLVVVLAVFATEYRRR
ncbi:MAG TPA: MFS transporter [Magnetospirillaceae bacterium]|nr:MFS transporter [Magnetospirillaceae bacterium]